MVTSLSTSLCGHKSVRWEQVMNSRRRLRAPGMDCATFETDLTHQKTRQAAHRAKESDKPPRPERRVIHTEQVEEEEGEADTPIEEKIFTSVETRPSKSTLFQPLPELRPSPRGSTKPSI